MWPSREAMWPSREAMWPSREAMWPSREAMWPGKRCGLGSDVAWEAMWPAREAMWLGRDPMWPAREAMWPRGLSQAKNEIFGKTPPEKSSSEQNTNANTTRCTGISTNDKANDGTCLNKDFSPTEIVAERDFADSVVLRNRVLFFQNSYFGVCVYD